MRIKSPYLIKPRSRVRLSRLSTSKHPGFEDKSATEPVLAKLAAQLSSLQEVLYAGQQKALLVVLQGMDASGKDGAVRHIFSGVNPQGCQVASFKPPTEPEARHDFLWRCHAQVPARGMIGVFNRSHYEDVLVPRVHGRMSAKQARMRMDEINAFEQMLADNDVVILKFFLHISREEQGSRFQARLDAPEKRWKLDPADLAESKLWPKYADAYEEILSATSRKHAPWFVIPADHKWFRDVAISRVMVDALKGLKLEYPKPVNGQRSWHDAGVSIAR